MFKPVSGLVLTCLLVAGGLFAQDPTLCTGSKTSDGLTFEASGGTGAFSGTVSNACGPLTSATSSVPWLNVTSSTTFAIQFSVAPNATSSTRSASVTATFGDYPAGPVSFIFTLTQFATLSITTSSLPAGVVGLPYSAQLQAAGGSNVSRTFTISSGSLPAGLFLTGQTISGTPTAPGTASFTAQVTDLDPTTGSPFSATQSLALTINPKFTLSTTSLPGATVGVAYSASLAATGGIPPYGWSFSSGTLPQGLQLDASTGLISGTPSANSQGTYPLTIHVVDQANETLTGPVSLHVAPPPLVITTPSLPPGTEGVAYSGALSASGGTPPYSWSATGLPGWLNLSSTGQLSGTPPAGSAGTYPISFKVQDSDSQSTVAALSVQVNAAPLAIVTTSTLPDGKEGNSYAGGFQASGGKAPYSWSGTGLPGFLTLTPGGGLSGTPPVGSAGNYSFNVTVTDALGNKTNGTFNLKVVTKSSPDPLAITTQLLSPATEGVAYSTALGASGGTPPYSWSATGLPSWLKLSSTGQLSGTPPAGSAGSYPISLKVQDAAAQSTALAVSLQVNAAPLAIVTTSTLPEGKEGNPYAGGFQASGGKAPYSWTGTGLPAFLTLGSGGSLSGVPPAGSAGSYSFKVTVTDALGNKTSGTFTLKVVLKSAPDPLAIATPLLPSATEGVLFSTGLFANGGTSPYSWSATGLPSWLHLSTAGQLSGTPPVGSAGSYPFSVKVQDATAEFTLLAVTLQVNAAPLVILTTATLPAGKEGNAYSGGFLAIGGKAPYIWSATGLPAFLTLTTGGSLSGTPPAGSAGVIQLKVTVTDASGNKTTGTFSLKVVSKSSPDPLAIATPLLAPATEGVAYSIGLVANGGTPPYAWSATGLPSWLILSTAGQLSGTPPLGSAGTYVISVKLQDANSGSTALTVSLQVNAAPLAIVTTAFLPAGKEGNPYGGSFQASGGTAPYTWSATGLPGFLTFTGDGTLSGKPPAGSAGSYIFKVTVTDSIGTKTSGTFTLKVNSALSITITPPVLQATEGHAYSATFGVSGGTAPYSWSAVGLPAWATLSTDGVFAGTPPVGSSGGSQFTVTAKDAANETQSTLVTLVVLTADGGITIATPALPDATVGAKYEFTLVATGGSTPYQWSGSGLPDGLTLASNGQLSGTPTSAGDITVTVQATDANQKVAFAALSLHIAPAPLVIDTPTPLPAGEVKIPYSTSFHASGGTRPQSWGLVSGFLPPGLTLAPNGVLNGTPTDSGVFDFTLGVTQGVAGAAPLLKAARGNFKAARANANDPASATSTADFEIVVRPYVQPDIVVSCGSLQFEVPSTGDASLQTCSLISTIFNSLPYTVTVDTTWLTVTKAGLTPGRIDVSVDASGLAPGVYTATITISSPGVISKTIPVTLTITAQQSTSGVLKVSPLSLTVSSPGSPNLSDTLFVQNIGDGDLTFTASVDVPWLKLSPESGLVSPGTTLTLQATILAPSLTPGAYLGTITIDSPSGAVQVPANLLVSKQRPRMVLSRDGILLVARQGNGVSGPAPTTFLVWSSDDTDIHYTVQQIGGEGWLSLVSDQRGTATDSIAGKVAFQAKSAGLAKGAYYALIRLIAPEPYNPLVDFLVVLDVQDASTPPVPDPDPSGLVFAATGGINPPDQPVTFYTSSDQPLGYQVAVQTDSGAWLSASPLTGAISTTVPGQLTISVNAANLPPGIYRGGVNISISNLEVRTVNVTLIVPDLNSSSLPVSGRAAAPSGSCTPANLVVTETGSPGNFSAPAGWPGYLAVQLSDNCGNPILHGDVVADFSNGDSPLSLKPTDPKTATYSATWTPVFPTSQLTISIQATATGLKQGTTQLVGGVTDTPYPILKKNSTLNNLYPRAGAPLAPATIVAIYGSAFAPTPASASGALPTTLNGTSVIIGGELAPLYYVSPNQINAQLPADLLPDQEYQVLVLADTVYSTPDTIRIDPATPGVARLTNGQVIAQHQDYSQVTPDSPAKPGEYLVVYLAGMGLTKTPVAAGAISPSLPLASVNVPATVTLAGEPVSVLFAGLSPGFVGLYQVNFQVPADAKSGSLELHISQAGVAANTSVLVVGK